ncbi:hypothetical protein [Roseofilum reptotaenium]|uniref:hypothetical protein n=1 Tax=Roseofilum reptotaenium TaxID=1233427 RepID=UPI0036F39BA9
MKGDAGTGKSRLIEEFLAHSASLDDNLLFTRGNCNAQTGISNPYIPFRNILAMLGWSGSFRCKRRGIT